MKLVSPEFVHQINMTENRVEVLVLEDPKMFSDTAMQLKRQSEGEDGKWIMSENGKPFAIEKTVEVIIDPFSVDLNNKKMLLKLYTEIEKSTISSLAENWNILISEMVKSLEVQIADIAYSLDYRLDIGVKDFLKLMDLKFSRQSNTLIEQLIDYTSLAHEVMKISAFIFVNIMSYLTDEERAFLYQKAFYEKFFIILIESSDRSSYLETEHVTVVDKDYCVIQKYVD